MTISNFYVTSSSSPRIAIIGGGAAGFFAAIAAKEQCSAAEVVIFEKGVRPLAKVKITGGGRCNLTNTFANITDLKQAYPRGHQLLKRLFRVFDQQATMKWFESHHVPLTIQENQCVFPRSQSSQSIIDALTLTAQRLGVMVKTSSRVHKIAPVEQEAAAARFALSLAASSQVAHCDAVIVTTGGEPRANAWEWLSELGHEIVAPQPSLFTFNIPSSSLCSLMGTVVPEAVVFIPGTKLRATGDLLVTHWGISGPATLRLSAYAARHLAEREYRFPLSIAWSGETNAAWVAQELQRVGAEGGKQVGTVRPFGLPHRLWKYLLERAEISLERRWAEVGRKGKNRLIELLTNDVYQVEGRSVHKEEFVTAGGVSLTSIDPKTLQSKAVEGLFFAGEVLDIDGITGGFNLQAAWTTGYVAGQQAAHLLSMSMTSKGSASS